MKYCRHCGKQIFEEAVICPHCGCSVPAPVSQEPDIPSTGLNVLSFFIPLVGLILFCVYQEQAPRKAKEIGKWALIGFCTCIGVIVLLYLGIFSLLIFMMGQV